jgi:DNA-binding transcriptional LysR family regulator
MDVLSAMKTMVRVVDAGSFSAAGRQLGVSQSAVSKVIAQLESKLGVKLLRRTTRGLSTTDAGKRYYVLALQTLETAEEAEAAARDAVSTLSGQLRLSTAVSFGRLQVVPHLGAFMAAHPGLSIDLVMDDRPIDLIEEGVDVALRLGPQPDSRLSGRIIGSRRRIVVAAPAYLERFGMPAHPTELARHEMINLLQPGMPTTWTFTGGDQSETVATGGRLRVTANEGVREAVLAGLGLAVGTEWGFEGELAAGSLQEILADWHLPRSDLWAITPAGRHPSSKVNAVITYFESRLARKGGA